MTSIASISPQTKLCAIIGNPVEHSMSPALHNKAFETLGLDYVYLAFKVEPQNVRAALDGIRAMENFVGLSVTIPHKVAVIECVDDISPVDASIGSINTIINKNGRLRGIGTDGPGARQALLDNGVNPKSRNVTILGTGGAARAIAFDLVYNAPPSSLRLIGIVDDELKRLVSDISDKTDISVEPIVLSEDRLAAAVGNSEVLINATPVGMYPAVNKTPVPSRLLHKDLSVMDIVYNPLDTQLLTDAKKAGLKTISGLEMFVNQAVVQFENWTGKTAPKKEMHDIVLHKLKK